jgi:hypothetical protein
MAQYDLFVFCKVCAGVHEIGTTVTLTDGPSERESIGHAYTYQGKCIPPKLGFVLHTPITCTKSGTSFVQEDPSQMFLVPIE